MPRKLSRAQRLVATIGGAICIAGALPGAAMAAECPVQPTSKVFAQFGDANKYYLAPGGAFETLSWSRIGSIDLSTDNDPFELAPGHRSVRLGDNDGVSTTICVDRTMPHLRFVAKASGDDDSRLDVTIATTYNGATDTHTDSLKSDDYDRWTPTSMVNLKTGVIPAGASGNATITFRSSGTWRVDNVFVDPFRR